MKILVTGGAGYIGSVVTAQLVESGYKVIVLDNLLLGHKDAVHNEATFIKGDIRDLGKLIDNHHRIDAVLHFGAFSLVGESVNDPLKYWENNTISTIKMLSAMKDLGIKKLIFSSTAATYGEPESTPISETTPAKPTNPYGMSKLAIDMTITSFCKAYGFSAISLRYFNVAGAYKNFGERHKNETHLIPLIIKALKNGSEFTIFGNDYSTKDGTCVRDYIHVSDLARAHVLALNNLPVGDHKIYNLGCNKGFSNLEVIQAIEKVAGQKLPYKIGPRRHGDPPVLVASNTKAKKELGWAPEKTLKDMVQDHINALSFLK